jgi:hypothetical protein
VPQGASAPAADDDDAPPEQLSVRDDFAIALHLTDARSDYLRWLGRVLGLLRKPARNSSMQGSKLSLSEPLDNLRWSRRGTRRSTPRALFRD